MAEQGRMSMLVSLGKADFGETATQYRHLLHGTRLALLRNTATFSSLCRKPERSWVSCFGFLYRLQPCSEPGAQLNLSPGLSSGEDVSRRPDGCLLVAQVPGSSASHGTQRTAKRKQDPGWGNPGREGEASCSCPGAAAPRLPWDEMGETTFTV